MSKETLNGKLPVLSLQKNAQLGGLSRDHLRVYQMGNNVYGIAATRDLHPSTNISSKGVTFGHYTSSNLNGERDLIMQRHPARRSVRKSYLAGRARPTDEPPQWLPVRRPGVPVLPPLTLH